MTQRLNHTIDESNKDFEQGYENVPKDIYVWDDFSFGVNNTRINPATSKPDFDFTLVEYLFDPASTETVVGKSITQHRFKKGVAGLEWHPHVHWAQTAAGIVVWKLEYQIWSIGMEEPAFTTILSDSVIHTYVSGSIHQVSHFPSIDVSAIDTTACSVTIRLSRLGGDAADTYAVDARFFGFDFHVPIDQLGSRGEYAK